MLLKENSHRKEKVISKNSQYYVYYFYCSLCSKEIKSQSTQFKRHSGKCQRCSQLKEPYKFIYNELKNHRNKQVEFNLSFEEFLNIISNSKCYYCDTELIYHKHSRNWSNTVTRAHQLDRKNNEKGYIKDNVVPCCWTCNRLKSNIFTFEEFSKFIPILKEIKQKRKENER